MLQQTTTLYLPSPFGVLPKFALGLGVSCLFQQYEIHLMTFSGSPDEKSLPGSICRRSSIRIVGGAVVVINTFECRNIRKWAYRPMGRDLRRINGMSS